MDKAIVLKALTRLNDKATNRAAAEELSIIIRALDHDNLAALVQSICTTTTAWEPKPIAKKECIRALAQLPLVSCPMSDVVLQQYMPKILAYLRKNLQDTDSQVRDASCEALSAYAQALAEAAGGALPGSMSTPLVKVIFDCLAEQKKEGQIGAGQALLKVSARLGPLDRDLVKLLLRLLKSPSFLGTAQLLAAIASTDADTHSAVGLLKRGSSAFLPFINHLIGQPAASKGAAVAAYEILSSSIGSGGAKAPAGSGILGCLAAKDHAVRRAAADAMRAAVLLLGPALEPDGCWGLGDPHSITGRCMSSLAECRFDKVKEPRDVARDAFNLLEQLHRFVAEHGPEADWHQYATDTLAYTGLLSPAACSPRSPSLSPSRLGSLRQLRLQMSPIAERFRQAAVETDIVVEPGSRPLLQLSSPAPPSDASASSNSSSPVGAPPAPEVANDAAQQRQQPRACSSGANSSSNSKSRSRSSSPADSLEAIEQQQQQQQQPPQDLPPLPRRQWSRSGGGAPAPSRPSTAGSGSRPGSSHGSRSGSAGGALAANSAGGSRHTSATDARRASSHSMLGAAAGNDPAPAAAAGRAGAGPLTDGEATVRAAGAPLSRAAQAISKQPRSLAQSLPRGKAAANTQPPAPSWQGPSQDEWQQLQLQLKQCQALVEQLQQQAEQQHQQHAAALQQHTAHLTAMEALQGRITALEASMQQQQQQPAATGVASGSRRGSMRSSSMGAAGTPPAAAAAAAAAIAAAGAGEPPSAAPATGAKPEPGERTSRASRSSSFSRLYRSEDWSSPHNSGGGRRPSLFTIDTPGSVGRSYGGGSVTPQSGSLGGLRSCEGSTPGDLDGAYADALRGDRSDMHLMRLIQKTGPVWTQLSGQVSADLLAVLIKHVREGVMLHRVLPWLWRLADEDAVGRPEVPSERQQQLLEALKCCPAAEDPQVQDKVALLVNTLRTVWGAPAQA